MNLCKFNYSLNDRFGYFYHSAAAEKEKPTVLLNATILEMISLSMLENMESPMNSMSVHVSWSTKT